MTSRRMRLAASAAAMVLAWTVPAMAADLPAQDMAATLRSLGVAYGRNVLFAPQVVANRRAAPVKGARTFEEALDAALAGSGLRHVVGADGSVTILPARAASPRPGAPAPRAPRGASVSEAAGSQVDELVVTGVRASLRSALDQKRAATEVVDAIVAEDIGDFPDLNLSEALQRVTGVTVIRSANGEGRQISVRGAPAGFTQLTLNGFVAANGNSGRDFDFDIFASELFQNATLYKTPTADQPEGGLSATVDLRTPRPLDFEEPQLVMALSGQHAELGSGDIQPRGALLASRTFLDGRLGLLASVAYSETTARAEISQGFNWRRLRGVNFRPEQSQGVIVNGTLVSDRADLERLADDVLVGQIPRYGPEDITRERVGYTAGLQFEASPDLRLSLDMLHAELHEDTDRATIDAQMSSGASTLREITVVDGYWVQKAVFDRISSRSERFVDWIDSRLTHTTFGVDWRLGERWDFTASAGYSTAQEKRDNYNLIYAIRGPTMIDMSDPDYPKFSPIGASHLDVDAYSGDQARDTRTVVDDEILTGRADLTWSRGGLLDTVKFGVELRDQRREQEQRQLVRNFTVPFRDIATFAVPDDFLSDAPDDAPLHFPSPDKDKALALMFPPGTVIPIAPAGVFDISEKVQAGYLRTDWRAEAFGRPLTLDAGVRVVRTEQNSEGFALVGASPQPTSVKQTYTDVLPSATARFELRDDLVLRLSANKAIARPNLSDMTPGGTVAGNNFTATLGNPRLEPFRTTQFDASLEWYFAEEGLLQVAVFHKDISSFITRVTQSEVLNGTGLINNQGEPVDGATFLVSRPVNGSGGKLTGVEVGYQQAFTFLPAPFDGLGVVANATFSDSESEVNLGKGPRTVPLVGQVDVSYNLIGYYERENFSVRLAYTYRGDLVGSYVDWYTQDNLFAAQTDAARRQLDISMRYDVNDQLSVTFDGLNVLSADFYSWTRDERLNRLRNEQGAIYMLGVRAKF